MLLQIEYDPCRIIHEEPGRLVLEVPDSGGTRTEAASLSTLTPPGQFDSRTPRYAHAGSIRVVFVTSAHGAMVMGSEQRIRRTTRL